MGIFLSELAQTAPADGMIKRAIFGYNAARFYGLDLHAGLAPWEADGLGRIKAAYLSGAPGRSNRAYGHVARG
jgi:hypothetical protein